MDRISRASRGSFYGVNKNNNSILYAFKSKIRELKQYPDSIELFDPGELTVVQREQILLGRRSRDVRKVYLKSGAYKVGWVVDCDVPCCMICLHSFTWYRYRHHCRACGSLVCSSCSPYTTIMAPFNEDEPTGSRVCINCFGLKCDMVPPSPTSASSLPPNALVPAGPNNIFSPSTSRNGIVRRRTPNSDNDKKEVSDSEKYKSLLSHQMSSGVQEQKDCQECNMKMRQLIPYDISKTTLQRMLDDGVPEKVAHRIWATKALWLICMHPDDIKKVHIADLRGKYNYHGLDLCEMRAIGHTLPVWTDMLDIAKMEWREGFKRKLEEMAYREMKGTLPECDRRNPVYQGTENLSIYDSSRVIEPRFNRSASYMSFGHDSPVYKMRANSSPRVLNEINAAISKESNSSNNSSSKNGNNNSIDNLSALNTPSSNTYTNKNRRWENTKDSVDTDESALTPMTALLRSVQTPATRYDMDFEPMGKDSSGGTGNYNNNNNNSSRRLRGIHNSGSNSISNNSNVLLTPMANEDDYDEEDETDAMLKQIKQKEAISTSKYNDIDDGEDDENGIMGDVDSPMFVNKDLFESPQIPNDMINTTLSTATKPALTATKTNNNTGDDHSDHSSDNISSFQDERAAVARDIMNSGDNNNNNNDSTVNMNQKNNNNQFSIERSTSNNSNHSNSNSNSPFSPNTTNGNNTPGLSFKRGQGVLSTSYLLKAERRSRGISAEDLEPVVHECSEQPTTIVPFMGYSNKGNSNNNISNNNHNNNNSSNYNASAKKETQSSPSAVVVVDSNIDMNKTPLTSNKDINKANKNNSSSNTSNASNGNNNSSNNSGNSTVTPQATTPISPNDEKVLAELIKHLESGNAKRVKALLYLGMPSQLLSKEQASQILLKCCNDPEVLTDALNTLKSLVEDFHADVNVCDSHGRSAVSLLFTNDELGSYLMSQGADVLLEDQDHNCALSLSLEYGIEWMIDEFTENGSEEQLLESGDINRIRRFVKCLLIGGYANEAKTIIVDMGLLLETTPLISDSEATQLLALCRGNFDNMKEPIETFELLEFLGATFNE